VGAARAVSAGAAGLRAEYPVLRETAYLNAGTDGPVSERSVEAAAQRMRREAERGRGMASHWDELSALRGALRTRYAALVGAAPEEIALTRSTTDGVDVALAGLSLGPGDEVLTSDEEHVGLLAPLAGACGRCGATVRVAPFADVANAVGPRTRLVAVSHVSWMTGAMAPVTGLREAAPLLLLDGAQGAGAVPVDVGALGCDFYAASGQKWLCGPNGTGFLFVRSALLDELGMPRPSYITLDDEADPLALQPREGAARLDTAQPYGPVLAAALAGLDVLEEPGWDAVFERSHALAAALRSMLADRAPPICDEPTSLVSLPVGRDPADAAAAVERLAAAGVIVRAVPGRPWLRASTGAWNSEQDLERLVAGLAGL